MYNATNEASQSVSLLQRLDRQEMVSDEAVSHIASQEILSTRASMSINGKMLLGQLVCFVFFGFLYFDNVLNLTAVAWARHADRILFLKFPEVVFMDFTGFHTFL